MLNRLDLVSGGLGLKSAAGGSWNFGGTETSGGNGWDLLSRPYLRQEGTDVVVVAGGQNARWFSAPAAGTAYEARLGSVAGLYSGGTAGPFTFVDGAGRAVKFYGLDSETSSALRGRVISASDAAGNTLDYDYYDEAGTAAPAGSLTSITSTASAGSEGLRWTYSYLPSADANAGRLGTVELRNGSGYSLVRSVTYAYYTGASGEHGNLGDVKSVTVKDAAGAVLSVAAYRYYTPEDVVAGGVTVGYTGAVKYAFSYDGYTRSLAAGYDPTTAGDSQVDAYADNAFQYDSLARVTREVQRAGGAGCSCAGNDGAAVYTYSYAVNDGYLTATFGTGSYSLGLTGRVDGGSTFDVGTVGLNTWLYKTSATRWDTDGTTALFTQATYSNRAGQVMLDVQTNTHDEADPSLEGLRWGTYNRFDADGRLTLTASPAAVDLSAGLSTLESYQDLLHDVSGNLQYLRDSAGLVTAYTYYASTTATATAPGGAEGYLQKYSRRQGETGSADTQHAYSYFAHSYTPSGGVTQAVYPLASVTAYAGSGETGARTTNYAYTYRTVGTVETNQIATRTTTSPTVSALQNGPGTADTFVHSFDVYGNITSVVDGDGHTHTYAYDLDTGAVTQRVVDSGAGRSNLTTTYTVDALGRTTLLTDLDGRLTYTVYKDADHEVRVYPGFVAATGRTTEPITVSRTVYPQPQNTFGFTGNVFREMLTTLQSPHLTSGVPDGTEGVSMAYVSSLVRDITNASGQVVRTDRYFDVGTLAYTGTTDQLSGAAASNDSASGHYHKTTYWYDELGRRSKTHSSTGTITRNLFDNRGRLAATWVGTDDTLTSGFWSPTNRQNTDLVQVARYRYDGGGVGDGNLTRAEYDTSPPAASSTLSFTAARVTQTFYDWRNRPVLRVQGSDGTVAATANTRPVTHTTYNNLSEVTEVRGYDGDTVTVSFTGGVPNAPSNSLMRSRSTTAYDNRGRAFQQRVYSVDPVNGGPSTSVYLSTLTWYDRRGNVAKRVTPGGTGAAPVQKFTYDGANRLSVAYQTDGGGDGVSGTTGAWSGALDVTGDAVLQQTESAYDGRGNLTLSTVRQRFHTETHTGPLGSAASTGSVAKARVSHAAFYYDAASRLTDTLSVGTHGGTAYSRPSTPPTTSTATALREHTDYDIAITTGSYAGLFATARINPGGVVTRTFVDRLGRTVFTVQNDTGGSPTATANVRTHYTYDGANHVLTMTAYNGAAPQTTRYAYGVNPSNGSALASNDLLSRTYFPDPSTGSASTTSYEEYHYNALGEKLLFKDRNLTLHAYAYDALGRTVSDTAILTGTGVDATVNKLTFGFDSAGRASTFRSWNGSTLVNTVARTYNGFGQMTVDAQRYGTVTYTYSAPTASLNASRPTGMSYGRQALTYAYDAGVDDAVSRVSGVEGAAVAPAGTTSSVTARLEGYQYLGLSTVVARTRPELGADAGLTYYSNGATGDAGDLYIGLDRFGRVADQRWTDGSGADSDRLQYAYDLNSNPTGRVNTLSAGNGEKFTYDALDRLATFDRGTISFSGTMNSTVALTGTASRSQSWTLDAAGNWDTLSTDGVSRGRTHDAQNRLTSDAATGSISYDANGNRTSGGAAAAGGTLVYDAWDRMVGWRVAGSPGSGVLSTVSYPYDALGRRVHRAESYTGSVAVAGGPERFVTGPDGRVLFEGPDGAAELISDPEATYHTWAPASVAGPSTLLLVSSEGLVRYTEPAEEGPAAFVRHAGWRTYARQDANLNTTSTVRLAPDESDPGLLATSVERYQVDPYGTGIVVRDGSWAVKSGGSDRGWTNFFQGGFSDALTGLVHFGAREYDPATGRWLQQDPLRYVDGGNMYGFVLGSPARYTDPTGTYTPKDCFATCISGVNASGGTCHIPCKVMDSIFDWTSIVIFVGSCASLKIPQMPKCLQGPYHICLGACFAGSGVLLIGAGGTCMPCVLTEAYYCARDCGY